MSRRMKKRKIQPRIVKSKYWKHRTKRVSLNKKHKPKKPSFMNKNRKSNNDSQSQKKKSDDKITAEKSKLMCRRYEEFHENFLNYDKILKFLEKTQKCNPSSMDLIKIGNSTQGKPIYMVLITTGFSSTTSPKLATFIHAGLNGENAIAVSNTLYMIEYLTKNPNFVKIMDYYIIPCCNPDAYDEFIKNKEKDAKKSGSGSYCDISKKKTHKDISQSEKKDKRKQRSNSPKGDNKNSKKYRRDIPETKKLRSYSDPDQDDSKCCDNPSNDARDTKKSCSKSSTDNKRQKKEGCNKRSETNKAKTNLNSTTLNKAQNSSAPDEGSKNSIRMNLTLNFPVVLGLNDMKRIPTDIFLEKIKIWKESYINQSPETTALINAIYSHQFAIKMLISLNEGGEAICYPYGFCAGTNTETNDLKEVAKKGKSAITARNFEYGSLYDIQGVTYGNLMDFLKVDKSSIKYMYVIKVYKKTPRYNEKDELKQLMRYGCEIMECVKRMSCAVYKLFTNMTGNKKVEIESTKPGLDRRSFF